MTTLTIEFYSLNGINERTPYIRGEPISYKCDGKEGEIYFNGYYYVEDHAPPYPEDEGLEVWVRSRYEQYLPKTHMMFVSRYEKEPYKIEKIEDRTINHYKKVEEHIYTIEIYKRVIHECTNEISQIEDGDDLLDVCFFPTNKQTIYFRVLKDELLEV